MDDEFNRMLVEAIRNIVQHNEELSTGIEQLTRAQDDLRMLIERERDRHTALIILNIALMSELVEARKLNPKKLAARATEAAKPFKNDVNANEVELHISEILGALPPTPPRGALIVRGMLRRFFPWMR